MCLKLWGIGWIVFLKTKDPLNEWNIILIYYFMDFLKFQMCNFFKKIKAFKIIILK
jgi:hypothetical protein